MKKNPVLWKFTLEQKLAAQSALACVEVKTGAVKALVGGRDYKESKFNRAVQAKRQPGSSFKPFVYTAAMDNGFTPASNINDVPHGLRGQRHEMESSEL